MKKNWLTILLSIIIIAVIAYAWLSPKTTTEYTRPILSENLVCRFESKATTSTIVYSPDARRVAYVAKNEGKSCAVIDGVAGKDYDGIYLDFSMFSPDSTRVAYRTVNFGENPPADNKWFVVIDGEQGDAYQAVESVTFSPDSRHVAYIADGNVYLDRIKVEIPPGSTLREANGLLFRPDSEELVFVVITNGMHSVVVDGVPGQGFDSIENIVFSPDSNHLSYAAQTENGWCVVTDGVPGTPYESIENIVYSPDSNRLAYIVKEGMNTRNRQFFVVRDGEEGEKQTNKISNLTFSPDSDHLIYISETNISISRKHEGVLVVNEEGKELTEGEIRRFVISPDSNRIAYVSYGSHWPPEYQYRIFSDGEEIGRYDFIGDCVFSPDSQHVAYVCIKGPKMSVTLDRSEGQEYEILGSTGTTPSAADMNIRLVVFDSPDRFHYLVRKGDGIYVIEEKIE
ncbi:MAG: PD40 domain-containing protein [Dehalococcoidales bacterium]|nr:MAG: PD40 domain-containing protein [Dehalococcoidales bacterium]